MKKFKILIILALIPILGASLMAQEGRGGGRVVGKIKDENGNSVAGVKITMQSTSYNFKLNTTSDSKGKWGFTGFSKDTFVFTFEKEGFATLKANTYLSGASKNPYQDIVMKKGTPAAPEGSEKNPMAIDDESKAAFKKANSLFSAKNYTEALPLFKQFITKNPQIYKARINLANCLLMMKNYDEAVKEFLVVVDSMKKDASLQNKNKQIASTYASIGEAFMARNMYDKAAEYYTLSMNAAPPTDPAVAFNVAEIMFNAGKTEEAIKLYTIASNLKPDFPMYYSKLGYAYLNKGDIPNAVKFFEKFLKLAPNDPQAASVKDLVTSLKQ